MKNLLQAGVAAGLVFVGAGQARGGIPVVGGPLNPLTLQQMVVLSDCLQADTRFRARENTTELTGSKAAKLSERLSECVEQRMKADASESTNQHRKGK